jgi:alkanesulfonate monooxygenase SsuD/methylene tetrahydromethanopterin reductase-like flavin-dependent oxidoreductase (luciferase family)
MTRPLKVGVQLPEVEREVRWAELLDMTRAIEDLGFDSVWVGEHLLYRWGDRPARGPWEAWTLLAAIAASTSRIELGPLVACTAFHNPAVLDNGVRVMVPPHIGAGTRIVVDVYSQEYVRRAD